nr:hypothetical protein [Tanacetum cinerariifolium]
MCTRSRSRHKIAEPLRIEFHSQEDLHEEPPEVPMADNQTMAFDESFSEAWDHFNDLLGACPHHGFFVLHQLDTFYNALNVNDQDSLNSAAGGNFLDKMPSDCLKIIKSKSKVRQSRAKAVVAKVNSCSSTPAISSDVAELKDMVRALLLDKKNQSSAPATSPTLAPVKVVESNCVTCGGTEVTKNQVQTPSSQSTSQVQPSVTQSKTSVFEPIAAPVLTLRVGKEAITFNLDQTSRYSANYNDMTAKRIDVIDMACEEYSQDVLGFSDVTASGNPTSSDDPIVSTTSPTLTLFGDSDFLLFEEANAFLDPSYYDPEGDIQMLEAILNSDPAPSFPNHEQSVPSFTNELKACEAKTFKSFVDEPPEVELKDLPAILNTHF